MIPLVIIRPEPGAAASAAAARALGLDVRVYPLFTIMPQGWDAPPAAAFDALLIGSANALRHGGPGLAAYRALPVRAVGSATAAAARRAGFTVEQIGTGGLQRVLDSAAPGTRLLRLAGAERIALVPPPGVTLVERVVYASRPHAVPGPLIALLARPAVIALHSAAAARHVSLECARAGLARDHLALAAIGPRVSAAAGPGWRAVGIAAQPDEPALLEQARNLCHSLAGA